ncbi:hypothetical protein [Methylotenera sp. G11]|uniref:hypothetical protein n=1 Tax=Methylotenera sp. G11 TaxID=1506585 RepID=UPI001F27EFCC|nr:hypothetical protein [Methylotenera sp. G11]
MKPAPLYSSTFMRRFCCLGIACLLAGACPVSFAAEPEPVTPPSSISEAVISGKAMTSFRLRYEHVDQDGLTEASGLTLRSLIGWQTAPFHDVSLAAQLINVTQLQDNFNDGVPYSGPIYAYSSHPGKATYAKIVDPDYTGVNQLYLESSAFSDTRIRLGRQQVNLDNVRFIGDIGFRQVMQVYDGVSVLNKSIANTEIYLAHFESVRQINTKLRTDGALGIANFKYRFTPTESISAYGYFSSFDNLGFGKSWLGNDHADQSNRILGLRLDGAHKLSDDWKLLYTAEYARQQDYSGGDSRIDAHYYKLGGGAAFGNFSLRADQELLSSNHGQYAFQTPFGTNHLFQGWVDRFLVTPKEGIRDTFISAAYKIGDFALLADYHWLDSDRNFNTGGGGSGDQYGKEWNLAASYSYNKNLLTKVEYGKYSEHDQYAAGRIKDTDKLWLTLLYTF